MEKGAAFGSRSQLHPFYFWSPVSGSIHCPFSRNPAGVREQRTHTDYEFVGLSALLAHPCGIAAKRALSCGALRLHGRRRAALSLGGAVGSRQPIRNPRNGGR